MARLTMRQVARVVLDAGFSGEGAAKAVAVAWAESSGITNARNVNSDSHRSVDRGLWQINSYWHREVSDACADDPACAAKAAFRISNGGGDWSQWATWPSPASGHLSAARRAVGAPAAGGGMVTPVGLDLPWPGGIPIIPDWLLGRTDEAIGKGREWAEEQVSEAAGEAATALLRAVAPALITGAIVLGGMVIVWVGVAAAGRSAATGGDRG